MKQVYTNESVSCILYLDFTEAKRRVNICPDSASHATVVNGVKWNPFSQEREKRQQEKERERTTTQREVLVARSMILITNQVWSLVLRERERERERERKEITFSTL